MVILDQARSATLLVRVWLEDGGDAFRARLTSVDTSPGRETAAELPVSVVSSPDEVIAGVGSWLRGFLGSGTNVARTPQ